MLQSARTGEVHAPGKRRGRAVELAVHEIREAPEEQTHRHCAGHEIGQGQIRDAVDTREDGPGEQRPDHAAMEGHAALVHRKDFERLGQVVPVAVEEAVPQARAHHDADGQIAHEGKHVVGREGNFPAAGAAADHDACEREPRDVGDAVPAHGKRPYREGHGVEHVP